MPVLLQVIQQNQEQFVQMLNEPAAAGQGGQQAQGQGMPGVGPGAAGQSVIQVSPAERAAIDNVSSTKYHYSSKVLQSQKR